MGEKLNRWPLFAALDHGWYLGVSEGPCSKGASSKLLQGRLAHARLNFCR